MLWQQTATFDFDRDEKPKGRGKSVYEKDHAQLLEAEHWFKEVSWPHRALRVSALAEAVADAKAAPVGSFALRLDEITRIVARCEGS